MKYKWAKGRTKGIKSVRMDEPIYGIAKENAELANMSIKEYVANCVLDTHNMRAKQRFHTQITSGIDTECPK